MIPQSYPLFAIDAATSQVYLVVGWEIMSIGSYERSPVLAPVSEPDKVLVARPDTRKLIYSSRTQPLFPLPLPSVETAVLPAVRPAAGRLRP